MDQRRIDRILRNLVTNALEHGESKPVDIYVGANENCVAVAVRDHGIGMTEEQASKVFNRFWRGDPARARTVGGTGLGLAIATEDTLLHGGRLEVWAEPDNGACFRLTLPLLRVQPLDPELPNPLPMPPDEDSAESTARVTDTGSLQLTAPTRFVSEPATGELRIDIPGARDGQDPSAGPAAPEHGDGSGDGRGQGHGDATVDVTGGGHGGRGVVAGAGSGQGTGSSPAADGRGTEES